MQIYLTKAAFSFDVSQCSCPFRKYVHAISTTVPGILPRPSAVEFDKDTFISYDHCISILAFEYRKTVVAQ